MKTKSSAWLLLGFLLGSALLITSCAKEELQDFKEQKDTAGLQFQGQVASATIESVTSNIENKYKQLKATSTWMACGGSFKPTWGGSFIVNAKIISGSKSQPITMALYIGSTDALVLLCHSASLLDNGTASCWMSGPDGSKYYIKLSFANGSVRGYGWVPTMELDQPYIITIPGTSVTVAINVSCP